MEVPSIVDVTVSMILLGGKNVSAKKLCSKLITRCPSANIQEVQVAMIRAINNGDIVLNHDWTLTLGANTND